MRLNCPGGTATPSAFHVSIGVGIRRSSTLVALAVFLGLLLQFGCAGVTGSPGSTQSGNPSGGDAPAISLNPPSVAFKSVVVGSSSSISVTVTNSGTASLTITQATVSNQEFSLTGISFPVTLAVGGKATATVGFSPTTAASASGTISITSNVSSTPTVVDLSGTGVAATHLLGANASSISFGDVADGTSLSQKITLTNTGNSNVQITGVTMNGTGFNASGLTAGTTLTPNETATLSVMFDPTTTGSLTGSVQVTSNATNSPVSVALSGTGTKTASVGLSWNASTSSGITGYNVYRGTALGSYSRLFSGVSGTKYTDTTAEAGLDLTYYYVVTAVNSSGEESSDSNSASVKVP